MKKLLIVLMITISLNPPTTRANPPTCDQVLSACDKALKDQLKLNHDSAVMIKYQDDLILKQKDKIEELTHAFKSPYLYMLIGFAGGVFLAK